VILVTESGQNSIVVIPGSNGRLSAEDIQRGRQRIASAGIVLAQLETPLDCLEETLRIACATGVPVIVDPAPVYSLEPALIRQISWLTPNETEAEFLCGAPVPPIEEIRPFAEKFLAMGVRNLLLKLGERGAYLATEDGLREHIPGHVVKMVDSTGAGDALNGALATALMEGRDPLEAARFSVAAAAISVTRRGAIPSMATRPEIDMFMLQRSPV
jgi:ribokinase